MKSISKYINIFVFLFLLGGCAEPKNYNQSTPKETLKAIIEVIEKDKIEDFIHYLADQTVMKEEMEGTEEDLFKKLLLENMVKNIETIKSFLSGESDKMVHNATITKQDGSQLLFRHKDDKWYFVCSFGPTTE